MSWPEISASITEDNTMVLMVTDGIIPPPPRADSEYRKCDHATVERRARTKSNGIRVCVGQCVTCGSQVHEHGRKGINLDELPVWDGGLIKRWWDELEAKRADANRDRKAEFDEWYENYLKSPLWQSKRFAVLKRDGNTCQGCLARPATQVHHLHYSRVGCELAFDLISVCDECHRKAHPEKQGGS
jgi:5-methylcytosine-specific restriction endonuclease McrA